MTHTHTRARAHTRTHKDRPVAETSNWQHTTLTTKIYASGKIRTRSPSQRAAADPRFRPRGLCVTAVPLATEKDQYFVSTIEGKNKPSYQVPALWYTAERNGTYYGL